jgi:hypothetical protein
MKEGSRQVIHSGIHCVFAPPPVINNQMLINFQQAIITRSIDLTTISYKDDLITIARDQPVQLQVIVAAPPKQPTGEFVIISTSSSSLVLNSFIQEAEYIVEAFEEVWQLSQRQIISQDVTIRALYETDAEHAFQEIWESRLKQPGDSLSVLGGLVLGGGMRFVIPPQQDLNAQIEVKIESFLRDSRKIFIETQFVWPQPIAQGIPFAPREILEKVNQYTEIKVLKFMSGGKL